MSPKSQRPPHRDRLGIAPRCRVAVGTAVALGLLAGAPAGAQEVDLSLGRGTSDFRELSHPTSVAVGLRLPLWPVPFLHLVGGFRARWEDDRRPGTVCDAYWPEFSGCTQEGIAYETRLDQWEAGLGVGLEVLRNLRIRGELLRVRTSLNGKSVGAGTGRPAGSYYPDAVVWAPAYAAGVSWTPWLDGRLGLSASVRHEELDFGGCVTDMGAPFCPVHDLTTFEMGAVLRR